jgi:predicted flap endonuclease-1-like 5' DNA nuclease
VLYTLLKFLGWGVLLAIIGGCIGWALRALKCRAEVAQASSLTVDADEVDHMRHRLANLEQVVAERDRLRIQLADVRHADSPGIVGADVPGEPDAEPEPDADAADAADAAADEGETSDAAASLSIVPDADAGEVGAEPEEGSTTVAGFAGTADDDETEVVADEPAELDFDAAAAVLGKKIKLDDLTVVEGIGPKISELCSGIGVTTWRQLAGTDIAELQSMLDAAGSRYTVHKPGTWSQQAKLLATGKWTDFKTLTDEHDGGK